MIQKRNQTKNQLVNQIIPSGRFPKYNSTNRHPILTGVCGGPWTPEQSGLRLFGYSRGHLETFSAFYTIQKKVGLIATLKRFTAIWTSFTAIWKNFRANWTSSKSKWKSLTANWKSFAALICCEMTDNLSRFFIKINDFQSKSKMSGDIHFILKTWTKKPILQWNQKSRDPWTTIFRHPVTGFWSKWDVDPWYRKQWRW